MEFYDYMYLSSGLLNVLTFLYGLIFLIAKKLHRNKNMKEEHFCGCNERRRWSFCHIVAKSFINISTGTGLLGTSLFVLATSPVFYHPFLSNDSNTTLAVTLALTLCVFDLVLTLLTETISMDNIHHIPIYGVKMILCVVIVLREENSISGVLVLLMFGSIGADQLLNLYSTIRTRSNGGNPKNTTTRWMHVFRLTIHLLCNFIFPIIVWVTTAWFSPHEQLFDMSTLSIVVFFFAVTFFLVCNTWRFVCAWQQMVDATREVESEITLHIGTSCKNTASKVVPTRNTVKTLPAVGVYDNVVEIDEPYVEQKDGEISVSINNGGIECDPHDGVMFGDINLID